MTTFTKYIQNEEHYSEVISRITNDPELVGAAIEQFDNLWMGMHCKNCGRQEFCGDRIK